MSGSTTHVSSFLPPSQPPVICPVSRIFSPHLQRFLHVEEWPVISCRFAFRLKDRSCPRCHSPLPVHLGPLGSCNHCSPPQPFSSQPSSSGIVVQPKLPAPASSLADGAVQLLAAQRLTDEPLLEEVARQAKLPTVDACVVHGVSKIWHKVLRGPPTDELADWLTHCGWAFGGAARAGVTEPEAAPDDPKMLCQKCFRERREELKVLRVARLTRHMRGVS